MPSVVCIVGCSPCRRTWRRWWAAQQSTSLRPPPPPRGAPGGAPPACSSCACSRPRWAPLPPHLGGAAPSEEAQGSQGGAGSSARMGVNLRSIQEEVRQRRALRLCPCAKGPSARTVSLPSLSALFLPHLGDEEGSEGCLPSCFEGADSLFFALPDLGAPTLPSFISDAPPHAL